VCGVLKEGRRCSFKHFYRKGEMFLSMEACVNAGRWIALLQFIEESHCWLVRKNASKQGDVAMRHVWSLCEGVWKHGTEEGQSFAAFRSPWEDDVFLPCLVPITREYKVEGGRFSVKVLYEGTDKDAAHAAKCVYDARGEIGYFGPGGRPLPLTARLTIGPAMLPDGEFKVVKTGNTVMVVPGEDDTNRCLLFIANKAGSRGVSVLEAGTTGKIIKETHCCDGTAVGVIALLEPGQAVAFHDCGTDEVRQYTWDGSAIKSKRVSKAEWDVRDVVASPPAEVEVL